MNKQEEINITKQDILNCREGLTSTKECLSQDKLDIKQFKARLEYLVPMLKELLKE